MMKGSATLIKPLKQRSKSAITSNIFQDPNHIPDPPTSTRQNVQNYDFVGSSQFRTKLIVKSKQPLQVTALTTQPMAQTTPLNQTRTSKNGMNTTINRNAMVGSLQKEQQIQYTKQNRNLNKHKDYHQLWDRQKSYIKNQLQKKTPLLMDTHIKSLYVHPNQPKNDTINQYIVNYWEMSLRNHHPILERHIKGNHFDITEKEKLLQLRQGRRKVEDSIPSLPVQNLSGLKGKDLSVSGKNKINRQMEEGVFSQTQQSMPSSGRRTQEQVLKIDYDGNKRWMGAQYL